MINVLPLHTTTLPKLNLENDQEIEFHQIEIGVFHEIESFYKILHN